MKRAAPVILTFAFLLSLSSAAFARDYFVSPKGDDTAEGSEAQPWRTLDRVNRVDLEPGDRVLLEAGERFCGTLSLDSDDSGIPGRPVEISSYGRGRATIDAGNSAGIELKSTSHVRVRKLNCRGSGRKQGNTSSGILAVGASHVEIDEVQVSGFRTSGIQMSGVNDVRITRVHAFENGFAGISSDDQKSKNIYVGYCLAENNPGDPTILTNHSGNGIVIGRVSKALIEHCEARYNGWDMPRKGNGPVGIWTWDADQVIIQYCVSHHNRSTGTDGGGFDFDGGVTNSILQYNYSHDNHGSGFLICQYDGAGPFRNNIVRYNISQDDGLTNHNAGIYVWVGGAGMESTDCYNNTIFNSKGAAVAFGVVERYADQLPRITFRNNIFVAGEAQIEGGAEKGVFQGNIYWAMGDGGFLVDGYTSLDAWARATGQEMVDGKIVGKYVDPLLKKNGCGLLSSPEGLAELTEYQLLPDSPAIDSGLDLKRLFGLEVGAWDFHGNRLPAGAAHDIGAHEYSIKARQASAGTSD
ncbi:MAG TPA: right-handed parallel beta-helix repeat-containing protein [Acidobacteriota bacterium]|nr:right-handed parallel beta-helix repeat-containing protein [Acidobacteriota bacterium]